MVWVKIENNVVIQKQPYKEDGFIEVADDVFCTQIQDGDLFVNPPIIPKTYSENRAEAYPSIADQLDDIYHNGVDAWKVTIKTIKDKYPKE